MTGEGAMVIAEFGPVWTLFWALVIRVHSSFAPLSTTLDQYAITESSLAASCGISNFEGGKIANTRQFGTDNAKTRVKDHDQIQHIVCSSIQHILKRA
jgi:hypothetical protein